ncbi:MAG: OmpA family protein [Chitinophagales bacterium]
MFNKKNKTGNTANCISDSNTKSKKNLLFQHRIKIDTTTLFLLIILFPFQVFTSKAQDFPTVKELDKKAEYALKQGDTYTALDIYAEAAKKENADDHVLFRLGELQMQTRDYAAAQQTFKKLYERNYEEFLLSKYYYALMCKRMGEYEKAEKLLREFSKEYRGADTYYYKSFSKNDAEGAKLAQDLLQQSSSYEVNHAGTDINSAYTEFSPLYLSPSEMIYASLKADSVISYDPSKLKKEVDYRAKFYHAQKENELWSETGEYQGSFNSPDAETGNGAFSPDSQRFYFTRCNLDKEQKMICEIYKSEKKNGKWSEPEKLPEAINRPGFTATQPAVTTYSRTGGDLLYFASDRIPSRGGLDIWYSYHDQRRDRWQMPRNLGRRVNTIGDDMTPFYDEVFGYLYFSSDGWPGVGGLDIFKVKGEEGKYRSYPENLGFPINSGADDMYFSIDYSTNKGFIVSNRKGSISLKSPTCCDDIFEIKIDRSLEFGLDGYVYYKEADDTTDNKHILKNATVRLVRANSGIPVGETDSDENGFFFFPLNKASDYFITVSKAGYLTYKSEKITTKGLLVSDTLHQPAIVLMPKTEKAIKIDNIYYEYDSDKLTAASKATIDTTVYRILQANPDVILEIGSHTDSRGSDEYNMRLSHGRALSVVNYLIDKGIEKERLQAKGYGESEPVAPNTHPDGSDNPEGRAQNRRTAFKVIGSIQLDDEDYSIYYEGERE